jgi:hypothetical protein
VIRNTVAGSVLVQLNLLSCEIDACDNPLCLKQEGVSKDVFWSPVEAEVGAQCVCCGVAVAGLCG